MDNNGTFNKKSLELDDKLKVQIIVSDKKLEKMLYFALLVFSANGLLLVKEKKKVEAKNMKKMH